MDHTKQDPVQAVEMVQAGAMGIANGAMGIAKGLMISVKNLLRVSKLLYGLYYVSCSIKILGG